MLYPSKTLSLISFPKNIGCYLSTSPFWTPSISGTPLNVLPTYEWERAHQDCSIHSAVTVTHWPFIHTSRGHRGAWCKLVFIGWKAVRCAENGLCLGCFPLQTAFNFLRPKKEKSSKNHTHKSSILERRGSRGLSVSKASISWVPGFLTNGIYGIVDFFLKKVTLYKNSTENTFYKHT